MNLLFDLLYLLSFWCSGSVSFQQIPYGSSLASVEFLIMSYHSGKHVSQAGMRFIHDKFPTVITNLLITSSNLDRSRPGLVVMRKATIPIFELNRISQNIKGSVKANLVDYLLGCQSVHAVVSVVLGDCLFNRALTSYVCMEGITIQLLFPMGNCIVKGMPIYRKLTGLFIHMDNVIFLILSKNAYTKSSSRPILL